MSFPTPPLVSFVVFVGVALVHLTLGQSMLVRLHVLDSGVTRRQFLLADFLGLWCLRSFCPLPLQCPRPFVVGAFCRWTYLQSSDYFIVIFSTHYCQLTTDASKFSVNSYGHALDNPALNCCFPVTVIHCCCH